ncbi:MAG: hypothetical protein NC548_31450 [Lachnospiraceae bacterium]|nr:hypothetical protein [Lachnospiraceae bacterium]
MANSVKVNISQNFLEAGVEELPNASFLERPDVYYDMRNNMLSYNTDMSTLQWYLNYLESNARFASRNPSAYPGYLLNLGYIPVVFLPSCCSNYSVTMINKLDSMQLPYIKTAAYSFVVQRPAIDSLDAWVNKLDIENVLGIPMLEITSRKVVERIYDRL